MGTVGQFSYPRLTAPDTTSLRVVAGRETVVAFLVTVACPMRGSGWASDQEKRFAVRSSLSGVRKSQ